MTMKTPLFLRVLLAAFAQPSLAIEVLTIDTKDGKMDPWQNFLDSPTVERVE